MVGRRSEQAALFDGLPPRFLANLDDGLLIGQQPKIPDGAQPGQEVHLIGQSGESCGRLYVRVQCTVEPVVS